MNINKLIRHSTNVQVELVHGGERTYSIFGRMIDCDENFLTVLGTVGDSNGKYVLIPRETIYRIVVTK